MHESSVRCPTTIGQTYPDAPQLPRCTPVASIACKLTDMNKTYMQPNHNQSHEVNKHDQPSWDGQHKYGKCFAVHLCQQQCGLLCDQGQHISQRHLQQA